ncbi:ERF family protein [Butyrivibrio sp. INlla21]|uniref:ERF family protein n=1 Tax=Butyrivibrio sp. INlla21 TaxID=1520811 RepID=UPI0008F1D26D|nr:ERF family protein [Butyrivibrio sp. INlla21]SFU57673.1 ERF superfamily protein [Butyrivibrio sp. INlla21]
MAAKKAEETNVQPIDTKDMNIYQKMQAITQEISAVAKNLNVGFGKNQYKAVGEADVLAAVKPIEAKWGVYSYPMERGIIDSGILENFKNDGSISKSQFLRVATKYRFINMDKPEEYIDMDSYGDGVDTQDKAPGKAMTYSDKYSLLKAYKIITGDDPDQNYSQEYTSYNVQSAPKQTSKPAPKAAPKAEPKAEGGDIQGYPSREEMIDACKKHFNGDNLQKLLTYYKVDSIDALDTAQLAVAYGTAMKNKTA